MVSSAARATNGSVMKLLEVGTSLDEKKPRAILVQYESQIAVRKNTPWRYTVCDNAHLAVRFNDCVGTGFVYCL